MKKNILIIGPFGDFGGRELESSFIGNVLSKSFNVTICSTGYFSKKSQLYNFENRSKKKSLLEDVFNHNLFIKIAAILLYLRGHCRYKPFYYTINRISKKYLNIENRINLEIEKLVDKNDLVLICAQLTSSHMKKIINYSYFQNKNVFFRTTGLIDERFEVAIKKYNWLNNVSLFINHSTKNSTNLFFLKKYYYSIIDQCAFNEKELIKIPILKKQVKSFLTMARLTKGKNIDVVINAFLSMKDSGDKLYIIGDGPEFNNLLKEAKGNQDIIFTGYLENNKISEYLKIVDCVIISYYKFETGPLTGIEAMASAKIIISTKMGAMEERLPFNKFWFDNSSDALSKQLKAVKKLSEFQVFNLSSKIRNRYLECYSEKIISRKYLKTIK